MPIPAHRCLARAPRRAFASPSPQHCTLTGFQSVLPPAHIPSARRCLARTPRTASPRCHQCTASSRVGSRGAPSCPQVSGQDSPEGITSFEDVDLPPSLMENVKRCKYTKPTPVQVGSHTRHRANWGGGWEVGPHPRLPPAAWTRVQRAAAAACSCPSPLPWLLRHHRSVTPPHKLLCCALLPAALLHPYWPGSCAIIHITSP